MKVQRNMRRCVGFVYYEIEYLLKIVYDGVQMKVDTFS